MPTAGSLDLPSFRATVGHRAGAGGSAQWRGEQRHHARAARKAGAALRDVSTGVDSAPRGIDRPRLQVPHRPAACSCERRWRRGGTRAGGSLRSRGARVGERRVRTQTGLLRARERPAGSGGAGVHARWRSAEGRRLVGTQSSRAAGRPFASVRARAAPRPAHSGAITAGRHAGCGGLLTSSRCRAGAASPGAAVHARVGRGAPARAAPARGCV